VQALRARRDPAPCASALSRVEEAARNGNNLIPHILEAVERQATLGEIADTLRKVFGEFRESVVV
jgi:methylmalonyl-CoA mutase N-terminal domain/subunit